MIAQYVGFTVIFLIERRTRAFGRLKKIRCRINRQVRTHAIHELFGLIRANGSPGDYTYTEA
jgi:hypothetical protein